MLPATSSGVETEIGHHVRRAWVTGGTGWVVACSHRMGRWSRPVPSLASTELARRGDVDVTGQGQLMTVDRAPHARRSTLRRWVGVGAYKSNVPDTLLPPGLRR